ncbi:MAG: ABC transporter permease [Gammaproteobacteria bacterium]|nr:MAG: ABC transporter permease [Gammaproteobacteria bacterium]PIE35451.1 MAG: ABC transporter permease [Gammaproteobacteria bacterium]
MPAVLVTALFSLPVLLGLAGAVLPAFGLMPVLAPGNGFASLLAEPTLAASLRFTVQTGVLATVCAFLMTLIALVSLSGTRLWRAVQALLPPLLAVPHAALAVGLVFLIAPSGFLVRLVSPELSGWERPPTLWLVPDAGGWTLILGLVLKEFPFLLLVSIGQLATIDADAALRIGRSLGYSPARCWSRLILPQLYPRIRLALLVVLGFNLSVVDMALILGPGSPPSLSVLVLQLLQEPGSRAAASAGALVLLALTLLSYLAVLGLELPVARVARWRRQDGQRGQGSRIRRSGGRVMVMASIALALGGLLLLPLWSVAQRWRFPDMLPSSYTLREFRDASLFTSAENTLILALLVMVLALVAAMSCLEAERRSRFHVPDIFWYLPLLIPQASLLFGWQAALLWTGSDERFPAVVHAHWMYALSYVFLLLAVAWRAQDDNWELAANSLGAGYWRTLWRVRLPLLAAPLAQAAAVAVAVSVAQYLPTLLLGAGRYPTLTTDLVTSFGGLNRRVIAGLALLQSLLPLLAFSLALALPRRWLPADAGTSAGQVVRA